MGMHTARKTALILLLVAALTSCSRAGRSFKPPPAPTESQDLIRALRALHFDKYLTTPPLVPEHVQVQGWDVYRYGTEELRCIDGGEYFLLARKGAESGKTVIWFEGGGACYPGREDCLREARLNRRVVDAGLASSGEHNPVRNWNFIYVPYCDGSIHLGDQDADYDGDGVVDHWHWGLRTTSAAVRLMGELFPASQSILIAGCSAGGAGTMGATPVVRLQFPDARLYVFNASGMALFNPEAPELYKLLQESWNIGQFIPSDCPRCKEQLAYLYSWLLDRDPALRVGVFSSYQDAVSSSGREMAPEVFQSLALSTTSAIRADHPSTFNRYFIVGDQHCVTDYSYAVNGVSIWDWVSYLVNEDPRWVDILE